MAHLPPHVQNKFLQSLFLLSGAHIFASHFTILQPIGLETIEAGNSSYQSNQYIHTASIFFKIYQWVFKRKVVIVLFFPSLSHLPIHINSAPIPGVLF